LWEHGVLPMLGAWQQLVGDQPAFAAARDRLLGYGGRVRIGLWLDDGTLFEQGIVRGALVLHGDGRTDLAALAGDLRRLQDAVPGEWQTLDLGGSKHELRVEGDDAMTAAAVVDGRVQIVIGPRSTFADSLAAARAFAASEPAKPVPPNSPAWRQRVDVPALVALARADAPNESELLDALGLPSLGALTLTIGTAGPHVQAELAAPFPDGPKGLFRALCPEATTVSDLQRLAPPAGSAWKVGRFDWSALYETVLTAVIAVGRTTRAEIEKDIRDETGIDLAADLFAHTTDEVLFVGSPLRGLDRPKEFTWLLAVKLKDQKAFAAGLATMLGKIKPLLSREETRKVGDAEVQRYGNMLGYDVWFATGHGLFVMAGGRDAEDELTALLAAAAKPVTGPAEPAPAFASVRPHLPPGNHGLARGDLDSVLGMPLEWWFSGLEDLVLFGIPAQAPSDPEEREAVRALLQQHNLGTLLTATGHAERTWRWRLYW
ncbi:MAG: hypothetical protein WAT39_02140, partial [Planctomycetota bacterium]